MNQDKIISIKCEGKESFDIDDLLPLQGKLKSITKEQFNKLKQSLIKDGLPLGFHVWKDSKDKVYICDGHHRQLALKALRDDGYFIPPVPCNVVIAKTKKEAAKIVLISNSKYAEMSQESLSDFMIDFEMKLDDLEFLDLPDFDLLDLNKEDTDKKESNEVDLDFKYKIEIDCENEEQQQLIFEEMENRGFKVRLLI